jgi:hypothetical protein
LYGAGNHLSGDKREENFKRRISVRPVFGTNFFPRRENPGISLQKLSKINLLFFKSYSNK